MRATTAFSAIIMLATGLAISFSASWRELNGLRHMVDRHMKVNHESASNSSTTGAVSARIANETLTNEFFVQGNHTAAPSLPQLPLNATGRAFVCITGQVKRLVAEKIKETLLEPLKQQGYEVDVALAMSDDALHSTNSQESRWKWNPFTTYQQVHDYFSSSGFHVVTNASTLQLKDPPVPPNYLDRMDKKYMPEEAQRNRVQNHARQFQTLTKCYDALLRQQVSLPAQNTSTRSKVKKQMDYYDFSIRLREDVSFNESLDMTDILPLLYPNARDRRNGTVLGTDCRTFGGLNDRLAIVSRQAFRSYFNGPWDHFFANDAAPEDVLYNNPETFLEYVYKERLHMNVIKSPKVRGVIKYVVTNGGSKQHPHLVTKPAPMENVTICPSERN